MTKTARSPQIDQAIARVRAFATSKEWSKSRYASEAKLPDTTLRHFHKASWNPTSNTLRKLEALIPDNFEFEDA